MTWKFVAHPEYGMEIEPADRFNENTTIGIVDWLLSDINRNRENLKRYRSRWAEVLSGKYEKVLGNGTGQTLVDGNKVVLESLYERWDDITLTLDEFNEILDKYAEYLEEYFEDK